MYSKEKKKIFGAHHLRSEDNIEVDFEELDLGGGGAGLFGLGKGKGKVGRCFENGGKPGEPKKC